MDYYDSTEQHTIHDCIVNAQKCLDAHRRKDLVEVHLHVCSGILQRLLLRGRVSKLLDSWFEFTVFEMRLSSSSGDGGMGNDIDNDRGQMIRFQYTEIDEIEVRLRSMCIIMKKVQHERPLIPI